MQQFGPKMWPNKKRKGLNPDRDPINIYIYIYFFFPLFKQLEYGQIYKYIFNFILTGVYLGRENQRMKFPHTKIVEK